MSISIAYKKAGKGKPIFFIHGIGSRKESWEKITAKLKNNFLCITYDLRGHGESKIDETNFNINDLVQDLENLRIFLKINKMHIVGHSLGGMIGPCYAKKYKNKVLSLTMLSTAAFRTIDEQKKILDIIDNIQTKGINDIIPLLVNRWFTNNFIKNNPKIINQRVSQIKKTPIKTFINVFKIYALTEIGPLLKEISLPSLIITGENDIGCNPKINKKIAHSLKNSKLVILPGAKHAITLEFPELVTKNIIKFINNINKI